MPAAFGGSWFLYAYGLVPMGLAVLSTIGAVHADGIASGLAIVGDGSLFMSRTSKALCDSLPGRTRGAVAVVRRVREQEGNWYEGSVRRR